MHVMKWNPYLWAEDQIALNSRRWIISVKAVWRQSHTEFEHPQLPSSQFKLLDEKCNVFVKLKHVQSLAQYST